MVSSSTASYQFLLPVWGKAYTQLFTDYALPSQLAPGNLPELDLTRSRYNIFTHAADFPQIESSPAFQALKKLIAINIVFLDENISCKYARMSECYRQGIEAANKNNAAIAFFTPDIIFANNSLTNMAKIFLQGYHTIFAACPTLDDVLGGAALASYKQPAVLNIEATALMDVALKTLHPNTKNQFFTGDGVGLIPACLYWPVANTGLLTHSFHLHPLLVFPKNKAAIFTGTVDDDYVIAACPDPKDIYIVQDSNEILLCELSSTNNRIVTGYAKGNINSIIDWALIHADATHKFLFKHPIRLKTSAYKELDAEWLAAEANAKEIVLTVETELAKMQTKSANMFTYIWQNLRNYPFAFAYKIILHIQDQVKLAKSKSAKLFLYTTLVSLYNIYLYLAIRFAKVQDSYFREFLDIAMASKKSVWNINCWLTWLLPNEINNYQQQIKQKSVQLGYINMLSLDSKELSPHIGKIKLNPQCYYIISNSLKWLTKFCQANRRPKILQMFEFILLAPTVFIGAILMNVVWFVSLCLSNQTTIIIHEP